MKRLTTGQERELVIAADGGDPDALRELIEAGTIRPVVDRVYPLEEAAAAVAHVESGTVRGKVVIAVI